MFATSKPPFSRCKINANFIGYLLMSFVPICSVLARSPIPSYTSSLVLYSTHSRRKKTKKYPAKSGSRKAPKRRPKVNFPSPALNLRPMRISSGTPLYMTYLYLYAHSNCLENDGNQCAQPVFLAHCYLYIIFIHDSFTL